MDKEARKPLSSGEIADRLNEIVVCHQHAEGKGFARKRMYRRSDGSICAGMSWSEEFIPAQVGRATLYDHPSVWSETKESVNKVATGEMSLNEWEVNFRDNIFELCHATASFEGGTEWDEKAVFERAAALAAPKIKQLDAMIGRLQSGELKVGDRNFKAAMGQICKLQG